MKSQLPQPQHPNNSNSNSGSNSNFNTTINTRRTMCTLIEKIEKIEEVLVSCQDQKQNSAATAPYSVRYLKEMIHSIVGDDNFKAEHNISLTPGKTAYYLSRDTLPVDKQVSWMALTESERMEWEASVAITNVVNNNIQDVAPESMSNQAMSVHGNETISPWNDTKIKNVTSRSSLDSSFYELISPISSNEESVVVPLTTDDPSDDMATIAFTDGNQESSVNTNNNLKIENPQKCPKCALSGLACRGGTPCTTCSAKHLSAIECRSYMTIHDLREKILENKRKEDEKKNQPLAKERSDDTAKSHCYV